jgi:ankyrin repeat protein
LTFKILSVLGWICFALDAAFVVMLFVSKNAGDDAAGQGVARGWSLVVLPVLLAAGGVLLWGTRSGSKFGIIAGTLLVALPFLFLANNKLGEIRSSKNYESQQAQNGRFGNPLLLQAAQLIDRADTTALRSFLAEHKNLPYTERDAAGHTLLGFAVYRALDFRSDSSNRTDVVRILFESGVPYSADAVRSDGDWLYGIVAGGNDVHNDLIELALAAGANPNTRHEVDRANMIMTTGVTAAKAALLLKHGADIHVLDGDGDNVLIRAVDFNFYPLATFYLEHGIDPAYVTRTGRTVDSVLEKEVDYYTTNQRPMEAGYDAFVIALAAAKQKQKA